MCGNNLDLPKGEPRKCPAPCNSGIKVRHGQHQFRNCTEFYYSFCGQAAARRSLQAPSESCEAKAFDFLVSTAVACLNGSKRLEIGTWGDSPVRTFLRTSFILDHALETFPSILIETGPPAQIHYQKMLQILEDGPGLAPDSNPLPYFIEVAGWLSKSFHGFMCNVGAVSPEVQEIIQPLAKTSEIILMSPSFKERLRAFHRMKRPKDRTKFAFYGAPLEFWHFI